MFRGQQKLPGGHQNAAQINASVLAPPAIRNEPADQRREIHKRGVESIDLGADLLHIELAEDQKEQGLEGVVAQHGLGPSGVGEQVLGHIKDQQSPHPIVGTALPHLREKQDVEAFGVTGLHFRQVFLKSGWHTRQGVRGRHYAQVI